MTKHTLTGNYRFRQEIKGCLFKKLLLVLQFEYHVTGFIMENNAGVVDCRDMDYIVWKDATIESLQKFNKEFENKL